MRTTRRVLVDWTPSVVLGGVGGHELLYNHAPAWQWLTVVLLVMVLPARRRFPLQVLGFSLVVVWLQWLLGVLLLAALGLLVALHAVAWRRPRTEALAAAALVEATACYAAFRFGPIGSVNDAVVLLTGLTLSAFFLGTTQRAQERYAEQLRRERNQRAEIARAEERTRIAREVHDIVAHSVSVMIALSEGAARTPDESAARSSMRQVAGTGRQALGELRRVLSVLRPEADTPAARSPQPGLADLTPLLRDVELAGLPVTVRVDGDVTSLSEALQATAYRVVQESLTNTLKHAQHGVRADVLVAVRESELELWVRDDGLAVRFDSAPQSQAGNGIRGMSERARAFGGSVEAGPGEAGGWVVHCVLRREVVAA